MTDALAPLRQSTEQATVTAFRYAIGIVFVVLMPDVGCRDHSGRGVGVT